MESLIFLFLALAPMAPLIDDAANYSTGAISTTDGGTVITGSFYRSDGFVSKFASNGTQEWITILKSTGQISSVTETTDEFVAVGFWPFVSVNKHPRGFGFIVTLDKDGKFKLGRSFEKGNYSEFHKVIQTQDGNFVTVGLVGNGDSEDGWIVKFSPEGKIIWYRACCDNSTEVFEDIVETGTNEFMIFGRSDDRPIIVTLVEKNDEIEMVSLFLGY